MQAKRLVSTISKIVTRLQNNTVIIPHKKERKTTSWLYSEMNLLLEECKCVNTSSRRFLTIPFSR